MIHKSRRVVTTENGIELGAHGTSLFPVAAYDNDYSEYEAIWHWHRELELIHMVQGSLLVSIPNEQMVLQEGETLFINSGVMHAARNAGDGECRFHTAVCLPEFLCSGADGVFWKKYMCPMIENRGLPALKFVLGGEHTEAVEENMKRFWTACETETFGYEFQIREQLSEILCHVIAVGEERTKAVSIGEERAGGRIKVMLEYIHENYMSELTTGMLAQCANISESECLRCFKNVLGITPIQYVKKYRLQLAADMLAGTDRTVTEIAGSCGFGHMSYFARAFQEMFGVTPREYRKLRKSQPYKDRGILGVSDEINNKNPLFKRKIMLF